MFNPKVLLRPTLSIISKQSQRQILIRRHNFKPLTPIKPLLNCRFNSNSSTLNEAGKLGESEKSAAADSDELEITTGMISTEPNEILFYYDNVYPRISQYEQVSWLMNRVLGLNSDTLGKTLSTHTVPEELPVKVSRVIPREKDGGVFVKYVVEDEQEVTVNDARQRLIERFSQSNYRPWFKNPLRRIRIYPVRGTPWIEDLRRAQSNKIKVEFKGEDLGQEALYSILRRYGPIVDIQPPAPGDAVPRFAVITFSRLTEAATARNCVNGLSLRNGKTRIHVRFIPFDKKNLIKDWVVEHPRIVIPILVALLATLAVIIFEPIRVWFIRHKLTGKWVALEQYPKLNWIRKKIVGFFTGMYNELRGSIQSFGFWHENKDSFENLWEERRNAIDTLKQWVDEGVNTFIVVNGPRGSGKQDLVFKHTLNQGSYNVLTIDCDNMVKQRSDSGFVKATANTLGYYPVFSWMNGITQFIDLAVQGLTGQKTGFAESLETQFKNMLTTASTAISETALENKQDSDGSNENYLQLHPEHRPVVVINNLVSKSEEPNAFVYKQVVGWAAQLIQSNIAHVLVVTDDVGYEGLLNDALPNQIFKLLPVGDANSESARTFVKQQFETAKPDAEQNEGGDNNEMPKPKKQETQVSFEGLDEALKPLGGRMTDLQAFARRLKSGETPREALQDMIEQAKIEVLQMYVMKPSGGWTKEQAWTVIKLLAHVEDEQFAKKSKSNNGFFGNGDKEKQEIKEIKEVETATAELSMEVISNDSNFMSPEQQQALQELERAEMISLHTVGGRIRSIKAGKPLYQGAFKALFDDRNLNAWMESNLINNLIASENSTIASYEKELVQLSQMPNKYEIKIRIDYIAKKMYDAQKRIEEYEKKYSDQQKVLSK